MMLSTLKSSVNCQTKMKKKESLKIGILYLGLLHLNWELYIFRHFLPNNKHTFIYIEFQQSAIRLTKILKCVRCKRHLKKFTILFPYYLCVLINNCMS